ncbi:MAG: hypothetical protein WBF43_05730 [Methylocella sp.]
MTDLAVPATSFYQKSGCFDEDAKIGMVDCHRAGDRAFKDRFWFVSGDDEHLHRRGKEGRVLRRIRVRRSVLGAG